jgi:hypothetical protein
MSLWLIKEIRALYHHHISIIEESHKVAAIQMTATYIEVLAKTLYLELKLTIAC